MVGSPTQGQDRQESSVEDHQGGDFSQEGADLAQRHEIMVFGVTQLPIPRPQGKDRSGELT